MLDLRLGDCVELMRDLPAESVDAVITSVPYPGVCNMWGDLFKPERFDDAHRFLDSVWNECLRVLRPGCKLIINIANTKRRPYLTNDARIHWWAQDKCEPVGELIWYKGYGQNGTAWGSFRSPSDIALADQHEYILVFRKFGKRARPDSFEKIDLIDFKSWRNTVWNIAPAKASEIGHVAPFPYEIPKRLIILYTFEGETVLDPFTGSATTALACLNLKRNFIGYENNPEYCALAERRIREAQLQLALPLDLTSSES